VPELKLAGWNLCSKDAFQQSQGHSQRDHGKTAKRRISYAGKA